MAARAFTLPGLALALGMGAVAAATPADEAQERLAAQRALHASDPRASEAGLYETLLVIRGLQPSAALRAEVEALTRFSPEVLGPPPDPDLQRGTLDRRIALYPVDLAARATLRSWDAPPARKPTTPGPPATAKAAGDGITYVESVPALCPTPRCDALGYPVPLPASSTAAFDGFRSYEALRARLAELARASADIAEREVGRSWKDRPIYAYTLGDADALTPEGFAEPAMLQNGGIHAREWASPEVVAGLVERFAARAADAGLYRYLLDTVSVSAIPVLNVDGFLQTQRFADRALQTTFAEDGADWPRDGRMRRKNLRDADEDLATRDDFLFGVDPNRNNTPFFDSGVQNSDDSRSLIYHGLSAGSEPENQALYEAARLAPESRLRLYIDTHSYGRVYFAADTGHARHDALQRSLAGTLTAVTANRYAYDPSPPGGGIGSTDEYFAYRYQVPAYTLEIEPGARGAAPEYPYAFGVTHDGFILPAREIERVREELTDATVAGLYRMAGPPCVVAAEIRERTSGTIVFAAHWTRASNTARTLTVSTRAALRADVDYSLWLAFDKPMRVRDGGAVVQYRGQNVPLAPLLRLEGLDAAGTAWSADLPATLDAWRTNAGAAPAGYRRYRDDALAVDFRLPATTPLAGARRVNLSIDVQDFTRQRLDADPSTALDFENGGWARYEDSGGGSSDAGGTDRSLRIVDDGSPLFGAAPPAAAPAPSGGGGGALELSLLMGLLVVSLSPRRGEREQNTSRACARALSGTSCARGPRWGSVRRVRRR